MAKKWSVYIADAFAKELYGGNQAGVVILGKEEEFPQDSLMCRIAGELRHSETAFVKSKGMGFEIRYFTPAGEVDLCGHATIGAFEVMKQEGMIELGKFPLKTRAQELFIDVESQGVWMDMASPREGDTFSDQEAAKLYEAYGLAPRAGVDLKGYGPEGICRLQPKIVSTGLSDIMLPVADSGELQRAVQDDSLVCALSEQYQVVGVHMFCMSTRPGILAECRNFAPLYDIPEESATGTSNGALTWYLYGYGAVETGQESVFLQGETMGRPSCIKSRLLFSQGESLRKEKEKPLVRIGGEARISLKGELTYEE